MDEQRLAYLQQVLKTGRTPLLDEFARAMDKFFVDQEIRLCVEWAGFKAEREAEEDTKTAPDAGTGKPRVEKYSFPALGPDVPPVAPPQPAPPPAAEAAPVERPAQAATETPPAQTKPTAAPAPGVCPPALRFNVKNARQGEAFDAEIMVEPPAAKPTLCKIHFPEDLGLLTEPPRWRIHGTPRRSGEFSLQVEYRDAAGAVRAGTLPFVVNPDPRTLWEDKPSDPGVVFWKEDDAHGCAPGNEAKIIAARRRGRSHAHKGSCCDDDYVIEAHHGWYLAIVADGAGSAKFSRYGSRVATRRAADFIRQNLAGTAGEDLIASIGHYADSAAPHPESAEGQKLRNGLFRTLGYAAHAAVKALHEAVADRSDVIGSVKELSTTLLIGLARKIGTRWFCAAYWVGDGAVGVYRRGREVILLGSPDSGEFSGQTRFLGNEEVQQKSLVRRLRFVVVEDMTAFLLMTDGVSDPKFSSEAQLGRVAGWDALWLEIEAGARLHEDGDVAARLHGWLDFWSPGEYDDRTLAIIY